MFDKRNNCRLKKINNEGAAKQNSILFDQIQINFLSFNIIGYSNF